MLSKHNNPGKKYFRFYQARRDLSGKVPARLIELKILFTIIPTSILFEGKLSIESDYHVMILRIKLFLRKSDNIC